MTTVSQTFLLLFITVSVNTVLQILTLTLHDDNISQHDSSLLYINGQHQLTSVLCGSDCQCIIHTAVCQKVIVVLYKVIDQVCIDGTG